MEDYVVVGRIGRAHGLRGEVSVEPRTDEPERRFAVGARLTAQPVPSGPARTAATLTVEATRWHQGRLLVRFAEIPDRDAAEAARGTRLEIPLDPLERPEDPEEFYDHQLVGLTAVTTDGTVVGPVTQVMHGAGQDLLVIDRDGAEVLVPFVSAIVPRVDLVGGRLLVEDRPGLLEQQ